LKVGNIRQGTGDLVRQNMLCAPVCSGVDLSRLGETFECRAFTAAVPCIRTAPMLRIHGYAEPSRVRVDIRAVAERMAARAQGLCQPAAWYRTLGIESRDDGMLTVGNGVVLRSREFIRLADCDSIVAFVLTVGGALDDEVQELSKRGELLEALFLETAAWLAVEAATKAFATFLRGKAADRGYGLTRRFGPGYADWALAEQKLFFSLFDGVQLSVRLLESHAMIPKMSRSGMYGLRTVCRAAEILESSHEQ